MHPRIDATSVFQHARYSEAAWRRSAHTYGHGPTAYTADEIHCHVAIRYVTCTNPIGAAT
jgi:hypothetical protein